MGIECIRRFQEFVFIDRILIKKMLGEIVHQVSSNEKT